MSGLGFVLPTAALKAAANRPAELPTWRDVRAQEAAAASTPAPVPWTLVLGGLVAAVLVSRHLYRGRPS